ncbi:response regulator transcription factor [Aquincola sp. J276]|uniref:response regulator transcription factor n=1 Tax=Aquincola sp. J276 TaxID=2898432 RepID=UPI002151F1E1|nr:response regulator transcription factor [Aquincola sp. J276]MCR5864444.1 response regulator transcription factor [Aquincola sp. J276]
MQAVSNKRLTVLISHAEPLLAVGLAAALRPQAELDVLLEPPGLQAGAPQAVDVIVTDYQRGLAHLAEARCHALPRALAGARVLVVAMSDREHEVRRALEAGVYGFLVLGSPIDELAAGVHTVGHGGRYLSQAVVQRMAESLTREALTTREAEVLRLVARGACNKSIARELQIAVGTVKAHMKAIMSKLDASSRTQAASIATRRGLVDLPAAQPQYA